MTVRNKTIFAGLMVGLVLPAAALAEVIEVPKPPVTPPVTPITAACPTNCVVVAKVTGYQSKIGDVLAPMTVPKSGRIVAWSITLGKPSKKQISFFETDSALGPAEAHFTVIKPDKKGLISEVVTQGPSQQLGGYLGKTVQFPLERTIPVRRGQVIALTSSSWAPVMAVGQPTTTSWRASRPKKKCDDTKGRDYSQRKDKQRAQYACLYRGVQLLYSVTIVSNAPKPDKSSGATTTTPTATTTIPTTTPPATTG
jgi:hypothetical protein